MQLPSTVTEFEGNLPKGDRKTFQIRSNPKMFEILSDGIYSDKVMAVIRELCCNAHDSTVTGGHGRPFTVNVPTSLDSNFWVEDTGLGIDPAKIVDIFWTYGASTKTQDNTTIGALGLGSKSPFAYTKSSFLVVDRFNGVEYKYFCFINEDGIPDGKLMFQSPTDEPNGVRVELAVRANDVHIFRDRIIRLFSFWDAEKLPKFVGDSTVLGEIQKIRAGRKIAGKTWELRSSSERIQKGAYAVMGGVPYPINLNALRSPSNALTQVCQSYVNITFPMGSLEFQVSREELSYTEATLKALENGAAGVIRDVLQTASKRLEGLTTPFELYKAYDEVHKELESSFKVAADRFAQQTFKLADEREFTGQDLHKRVVNVETKDRQLFNMFVVQGSYRTYTKGTQRYSIESLMKLKVTSPEELNDDGTVKAKSHTNEIPWFPSSVKPLPWTNQNRKRTPANYLHAGYTVTGTAYHRQASLSCAFIINDKDVDGSEGMRFYKEPLPSNLSEALSANHLFFINGFEEGKSAAETEDAFKAFVKGTIYEGAPIIYLSKLPNFKLPEAPKAAPKPRAPMQRGTIELRMKTFTIEPKAKAIITKSYDGFTAAFKGVERTNTLYVRHELAKPLLYVETNWGAPIGQFEKGCVEMDTIAALNALGLLDQFKKLNADGTETVCVALLSKAYIDDLERRKVALVKFDSFVPQIAQLVETDVEMVAALRNRIAQSVDWNESQRIQRLLSNHLFMKNVAPKIAVNHPLVVLSKVRATIDRVMSSDQRRGAAVFLLHAWGSLLHTTLAKLDGTVRPARFFETYPLLDAIGHRAGEQEMQDHIAAYINMVDAQVAAHKESERLEQLAQLHAEALFEMN